MVYSVRQLYFQLDFQSDDRVDIQPFCGHPLVESVLCCGRRIELSNQTADDMLRNSYFCRWQTGDRELPYDMTRILVVHLYSRPFETTLPLSAYDIDDSQPKGVFQQA